MNLPLAERITTFVLIGVILFLVIYNLVILFLAGEKATISHVVYNACSEWPILAVAIGVVIGHWFWPLR